jgi:hypothetical protein
LVDPTEEQWCARVVGQLAHPAAQASRQQLGIERVDSVDLERQNPLTHTCEVFSGESQVFLLGGEDGVEFGEHESQSYANWMLASNRHIRFGRDVVNDGME